MKYAQTFIAITLLAVTALSVGLTAPTAAASELDEEFFLDQLQQAAFQFFWNETTDSGLILDRQSNRNLVSTMAVGFQLTALCNGAERGWVPREQAAQKVLQVFQTLQKLPTFHGMFAHYYDAEGKVVAYMHEIDDGADVSETGFMMAGVITCIQYFNQDDPIENEIRRIGTELYEAVEWDWMLQDADGRMHKTLAWHWSPNHGFELGQRVKSTMELSSMITYLLAIGSPTHPIPADCWFLGWAATYPWCDYDGHRFICCPPLFAHQYAQIWLDFRNRKDPFANYFRNSIRAVRANREYCLAELYPNQDLWGLTFCDGPEGYGLYGYPPKVGRVDEDAVIPPTGAAGSMIFTPRESISCLSYILQHYQDKMWGPYGLYDAFSPRRDWFFEDYVAIDMGPIVLIPENYRSGMIWDYFMRHDAIQRALSRAGFVTVLDDFEPAPGLPPYNLWQGSECYSHMLTRNTARDGDYALFVQYAKAGKPDAALVAHPSQKDFSLASYLSVWVQDLDQLGVMLRDLSQNELALEEIGRVRTADGWSRLFFKIPESPQLDLRHIEEVRLVAEPGDANASGSFTMDSLYLTDRLALEKPDPVRGLRAAGTRMPGELSLFWLPQSDKGKRSMPFRYHVVYDRRPINDQEDFNTARKATTQPVPGNERSVHLTGLKPGQKYYFAIQAEDIDGNRSKVSENITLTLGRDRIPSEFMVDDFETLAKPGEGVIWSASTPAIKFEPVTENAISGARSLRIDLNKQSEKDKWAYLAGDLDFRNLADHRYLSFWVSGQANLLVKLWSDEQHQEELPMQRSALPSGWSPLYFDLNDLQQIDRSDVKKVLLFIEPGQTNAQTTIYIDSMRLTRSRN